MPSRFVPMTVIALLLAARCSLSTSGIDPFDDVGDVGPDDGTGEVLADADADVPVEAEAETAADADADADTGPCDPTDCVEQCVVRGFSSGYCDGINCYCTADADADADVLLEAEAEVVDDAGTPEDVATDTGPICLSPVGHDEDGDTVDDACDVCPTWFDPGQLDGDSDGLGDACEAPWNAALFGRIEALDTFYPSRLTPTATWATDGGTWQTSTLDVVTGDSSPFGNNRWLGLAATPPYAAEVRLQLSGSARSDPNFTAVLFGVRRPGTTYYYWGCFFEWDSRTLSLWRYSGGASVNRIAYNASTLEATTRARDTFRRLRATWDGETIHCAFDNASGETGTLDYTVPSADRPSLAGFTGFRVFNETAIFHSFALYR